MPRREPSAAPPSSTTIGCSVNGTGVNGSGMLTCAAAAVSDRDEEDGSDADRGSERSARAGDDVREACPPATRSIRMAHGLGI